MRFRLGWTLQRIGDVLKLKPGAVDRRIRRVVTMLKRMAETQTLSMDDVQDLIDEIDGLDGVPDGGLEPGVLRGLLGVLKQDAPTSDDEGIQIVATPHHRYRR